MLELLSPAQRLQETISSEVGSLFFIAVVVVSLMLFWKRAFGPFVGFIFFSMLVSVFIFQPQIISKLGVMGFKWLFGDYL